MEKAFVLGIARWSSRSALLPIITIGTSSLSLMRRISSRNPDNSANEEGDVILNTRRKPWPFFMYTSLIDAAQGQFENDSGPKSLELPLTELFCSCRIKAVAEDGRLDKRFYLQKIQFVQHRGSRGHLHFQYHLTSLLFSGQLPVTHFVWCLSRV